MTDVLETTNALLQDRPELEPALQQVLTVDAAHDTWTFDDVDIDSGSFGELVSQDIVESVGDEYRLRDQDAVRAVLADDDPTMNQRSSRDVTRPSITQWMTTRDWSVIGSVVCVLGFVVVMRTVFSWSAVFQQGHIVLLGNDPYAYLYWLDVLVHTDPSLGSLPTPVKKGEVLMVTVLWGIASLLGGTEQAVASVLAWYPVVAATLAGVLLYAAAVVAFDDRRVGLATVALYAVCPILTYRSALGYGDHHPFDYLILSLAIYGLVRLAAIDDHWRTYSTRRLAGFVSLSLAGAAQVHAWDGGAVLLLPIAAYLVARVAMDVHAGRHPLTGNAWTLGALGVAAILALIPHVVFGWSSFSRAITPALLWTGGVVVACIGTGARRYGVRGRTLLGVEVGGGLVMGVGVWVALPAVRNRVLRGLGFFARLDQSNITETVSLLSPKYGIIMTPVYYLGLTVVLSVAAVFWATWRVMNEYRPAWLALTAYAWVLFAASLIQLRFAAPLGIPLSIFGGFAFIYLLAWVDVTALPRQISESGSQNRSPDGGQKETTERWSLSLPDRNTVFIVAALFLLVGGFGFLQAVGGTRDLTIDEPAFDTAMAINDHAAAANVTWPENYVFTQWDRSRMYNYYVNGHSRSYWYAKQHYGDFLTATEPGTWYERLVNDRTGYVVVTDLNADLPPATMQSRLWSNWGSVNRSLRGLSHYRLIYANAEHKVYELVPGAILVGQASGETVTVRTAVRAGRETHTYRRFVTPTASGWFAVRVPYPGTYQIGDDVQQVSETAVQTSSFTGSPDGRAHWTLSAGSGNVAFDVTGGNHGWIRGANWTDAGLVFDGDDSVVVPSGEALSPDGDFTLTVTFRTNNGTDYVNDVKWPRLAGTAPPSSYRNTSGYQLALARGHILGAVGNGEHAVVLSGPRVDDGTWHTAKLVRNGTTIKLFLDGQVVATEQYSGSVTTQSEFVFGHRFVGTIKNVTVSS